MPKGNIEAIYRLSPLQEGLLFHTLYAPESGVYFEQYTCTLHGDLTIAAFERAWQEVVDRHTALRTLFTWEQRDKPLQIVRAKVTVPWEHQDWRGFSPEAQQERLLALLHTDRERGFTLDQAPLMRFTCVRLDQDTHQFIWSFHHLLLDGWSMRLVLKEVFRAYDNQRQRRMLSFRSVSAPERPRPRSYQEYIAWLQQQDRAGAEAFWRRELEGFTSPTRLTVERGTPSMGHGDAQQESDLPAATTTALQSMARTHQLTLNTLIQGAWALLLSRYSGEDDVVFGATVSGRSASLTGIEDMVGLFINTLPVRVRMASHDAIVPWLSAIQTRQIEMRQYEHSALVDIQKWSDVPPGQQLFESIVVFENHPLDAAPGEDGSLQLRQATYVERSHYPLALLVVPGARLQLMLIYDSGHFDAAIISRMLGHLQALLEGMATHPDWRLADVPLLTDTERQQMLVAWNDTHADYPRELCMHHLLAQQARRTPNAIAVIGSGAQLTYEALHRRANRLAHYLQTRGVGPEVYVGICLERGIDMIVALVAVLKAGGAYVPIDPTSPAERLAFILEQTQAPVLLTSTSTVDHQGVSLGHDALAIVDLDADWERIAREPDTDPNCEATPQHLAYIIYTSGSTGQPKGVQVTHQNLVHSTSARMHYYPEPPTSFLLLSSFAFDSSVAGIFWTLCQGGALVLPPPQIEQDMEQLGALIAEHRITHMLSLPSLYQLLLEHAVPSTLQSLHTVMVAGEACPQYVALQHQQRLPNTILYNEYGPTEATVWCTVYAIPIQGGGAQIPIGRPIANTRVYLLDAQGQPVPVGVPGEIYVGGEGLARGYLHSPELTAERFVRPTCAHISDTRLYRTGDLGRYLPDGTIEFLGRIDHQIKIRGYRVEPEEIEAVLDQHPAVRESIVVATDNAGDDASTSNQTDTAALTALLATLDATTADDLLSAIEGLSEDAVETLLAHGV